MPEPTVPSRPARRRREPAVGVSSSYDVGDHVQVNSSSTDYVTVQFGDGCSLRLTGHVEDVTHVVAEAYRQLVQLPAAPLLPGGDR